jgi:hypothetical protein
MLATSDQQSATIQQATRGFDFRRSFRSQQVEVDSHFKMRFEVLQRSPRNRKVTDIVGLGQSTSAFSNVRRDRPGTPKYLVSDREAHVAWQTVSFIDMPRLYRELLISASSC